MIKDFTPRLYQQTILATAIEKNTLVVLPTGLGKTYVFLMLAAQRLSLYPGSKILFLGPTKPLINQYKELFLKHLNVPEENVSVFTGEVSPKKRQELWKRSSIIFSTPQGLENDLISEKIDISEVSLMGFDEAHRATGNYSYVWIARQYLKKGKNTRVMGLTASPGADAEKITEVCKNLYIEDVEIRTDEDPDVKPYIKEVELKWIYVELPETFKKIQKYLKDCYDTKIKNIKSLLPDIKELETKRDLLGLQGHILKEVSSGNRDFDLMKALSLNAEAMKVQHAIELLESQGISSLVEYMESLVSKSRSSTVKAVKNLVSDLNFKSALVLARNLKDAGIEHPKYKELKELLKEATKKKDNKTIVFCQYRDSINSLLDSINKLDSVEAKMFVGQAKKKGTGLSQKEQIKLIEEFRENKFNVLIMSSVGEEGLDIPSVDTVIFYEPIPSAIRTIQRRGRTGRQGKGQVFILVAKGTRDEAYRWSSFHKEKRMHDILLGLKKKFAPKDIPKDRQISEFIVPEEDLVIIADYREKSSGIIKKLIDLGIHVKMESLEVGDYILSSSLVAEYKTVPDFIDSILDRRLFTQLREMKKYFKQLLIIEGEEDIFSQRKLHPNAVRGMLSAICIDYSVPIIFTKDTRETALLLAVMAKREQNKEKKEFTMHSTKPHSVKEQQEYIISSLPGVGPVLSKPLLKEFGSVKNIINASEEELKRVNLIGEKKAKKIKGIIDSEYASEK